MKQNYLKEPKVSVLVPIRNGANHIPRKIEELNSITYDNIEILISVNQSTDNSSEKIQELVTGSERYKIFIQEELLEISQNFAFLVNRAKGDFVVFTAVDDVLSSTFISEALNMLKLDGDAIAVVASSQYELNSHGPEPVQLILSGERLERILEFIENARVSHALFYCLAQRDLVKRFANKYPKEFIGRDWIFNIELLLQGRVLSTRRATIIFGERGISRGDNAVRINQKGLLKFLPYLPMARRVLQIALRERDELLFPLVKFALNLLIGNVRRNLRILAEEVIKLMKKSLF